MKKPSFLFIVFTCIGKCIKNIFNYRLWTTNILGFFTSRSIWESVFAAIITFFILAALTYIVSMLKPHPQPITPTPTVINQQQIKAPAKLKVIEFTQFQNLMNEHREKQKKCIDAPEVREKLLDKLVLGIYGELEPLAEDNKDLGSDTMMRCAKKFFSVYSNIMKENHIDSPDNLTRYQSPTDPNISLTSWVEVMEEKVFSRLTTMVILPEIEPRKVLLEKCISEIRGLNYTSDEKRNSQKQRILSDIKDKISEFVVSPDGYYIYNDILKTLDHIVILLWQREIEIKHVLTDEEIMSVIKNILMEAYNADAV